MNLYPVKLTDDGGQTTRNCRLVFEHDRTTIYRWDKEAADAVAFVQVPEAPQRVGATASWLVGTHRVDPQRGCGCSHPMYAWVPPA